MPDMPDVETLKIPDFDAEEWNDFAISQGWSDGLPLLMPTEELVDQFVKTYKQGKVLFPPMPPRFVIPTLRTIAANAVMAGCRVDYFPVIVAAVRGSLCPAYNLSGSVATTHSCAPTIIVNGPIRQDLKINCSSNCFGQGTRANATIGRALQLVLSNVGGATPGVMDRATQGSSAKYTFCFGENEEQSPWEPYHVRRGFDPADSVATTVACEPPHNINDHASVSGTGILTTIAETISQTGVNIVRGNCPYFVVLGPEHAATLHRDGWNVPDIQLKLYEETKVHISRIWHEQIAYAENRGNKVKNDHLYLTASPDRIQVLVAGGAGKHSAYIPTFSSTEECSIRISGH